MTGTVWPLTAQGLDTCRPQDPVAHLAFGFLLVITDELKFNRSDLCIFQVKHWLRFLVHTHIR